MCSSWPIQPNHRHPTDTLLNSYSRGPSTLFHHSNLAARPLRRETLCSSWKLAGENDGVIVWLYVFRCTQWQHHAPSSGQFLSQSRDDQSGRCFSPDRKPVAEPHASPPWPVVKSLRFRSALFAATMVGSDGKTVGHVSKCHAAKPLAEKFLRFVEDVFQHPLTACSIRQPGMS